MKVQLELEISHERIIQMNMQIILLLTPRAVQAFPWPGGWQDGI